jgi:hypothetical protein
VGAGDRKLDPLIGADGLADVGEHVLGMPRSY